MVFDRHAQAVEPPTWDIIAPPFTVGILKRSETIRTLLPAAVLLNYEPETGEYAVVNLR